MEDLGAPISYLMLEKGAHVYSADGERIGRVKEIRADTERDIFDGIVVDHNALMPGGDELITADRIESIHEGGVVIRSGD